MTIGVIGCRRDLPVEFPLELTENSGNMIHGNAPFEMFDDVQLAADGHWRLTGAPSFAEFVNRHCSHLIVTMANTLKLGDEDGTKYARLHRMLSSVEKPVVIFGLGVQARSDDLDGATLPPEAIDLMRFLGERCAVIGVRGQMTADVFRRLAGVENTMVTGCPSMFSRPQQLARLPQNLHAMVGQPAYAGTRFREPHEKRMLRRAVRQRHFLVEPANRHNHRYHLEVSRDPASAEAPHFLRRYVAGRKNGSEELRRFFETRYRLFRDLDSWYDFNEQVVSYTYGTRFHVNMASVLSGKPALWVTHDARTRELTEFLHLPSVPIDEAVEMDAKALRGRLDYDDFFAHIGGLFDNFNEYLALSGLPEIERVAL